ncbi:MAG: ABC transporter permease subunit [Acidimicrobiia bacterium]|nr:ABC transporter permease subunit [Acidimicrobiia bacterium]
MLANVFTKTVRDRWRVMAIALAALVVMLLLAMSVYSSFDFSLYDDLPEAFRSLMNIPDNADAGSLAIGVLAGLYGAFTLGGLAISMGSASIAGEEKDGTIGILLGNPKSRTDVLLSKMANMVLLTTAGVVGLFVAAYAVSGVLDVNLGEMQVGAYMLHLLANVIFYGMLALAIGAWTGSRGLASGVSAGVMVIGFIAVGIFPLIEGWENLAKVFPWYYFDGADPMNNGVSLGHMGVLLGSSIALGGAALVGVNRRDLKGQTVGTTLLDRLRANPLTQKVVDRLAGSTRVSRIWIKTASEHQGLLIIVAYVMFLIMGVLMGPLYALMDQVLLDYTDQLPEELWAFVGSEGGGMGTPEGFYEVETFGLMVPIATMVVAIVIGARGLAGEEANRTMGLLLASPIKRRTVVVEKAYAMVALTLLVGVATWAGVWIGSLLGGLGMNPLHIAAASLLGSLIGTVFGAFALAASAATGRVRAAVFAAVGVALVSYLINSISILNDTVEGIAAFTPFDYYLTGDPLNSGMHWGHGAILASATVLLIVAAVWLFDRRDLRQSA